MSGTANLNDVEAAEANGLPADLPSSTYEMICRGASLNPEAPALSFFLSVDEHHVPDTWTYRQLLARITQTANFFDGIGVTKDSVIAFVLPNLPESHFVIWGGQATGIVTALNPLLEGAALAELLNAANATVLVTLAPFPGTDIWSKLQPHLASIKSLRHLVLVNLADRVRGPRRYAAQLMQKSEVERLHGSTDLRAVVPPDMQIHDLNDAICEYPSDRLNSGRCFSAEDTSSYFCTGGTTGLPKLAMRKHGNEVANAWSTAQVLGDGIGPGKVVFCGLPLFHVNGVLVTGLLPFSRGAHVILGTPQGYRGEGVVARFWEIVEYHRVNFFSAVPTIYASLLQIPIGRHDVSSLEYGLCGAAPMPVEVFRNFENQTGIKVLEGYGLTEATCVSSVNPPLGERRLGSIGLRIPGQKMKVVELDEHGSYVRDCARGEVGVLTVAGPNVFVGYRIADQNSGIWIDCGDGLRWLNTGDLARQDEQGYFWLTGRKKELIIRGGHNIDPQTIEEPLHRHPAVAIAAAVGRPDAHLGELPVAYVQLRPDTKATEAELLEFLKGAITERAALPRQVRIVEAMPLTAVGKIFKPALKHRETRDALETALRNAHVPFQELVVMDDKSRGIVAELRLNSDTAETAARQVLGRFPFQLSIV